MTFKLNDEQRMIQSMVRETTNKTASEAKVDPNAWMVTFGDLIMLLLTFFVMLLSMKSMDSGALKEKFQELSATTGPMEHADLQSGGSVIETRSATCGITVVLTLLATSIAWGQEGRPREMVTAKGVVKGVRPGMLAIVTEKGDQWLVKTPERPQSISFVASLWRQTSS